MWVLARRPAAAPAARLRAGPGLKHPQTGHLRQPRDWTEEVRDAGWSRRELIDGSPKLDGAPRPRSAGFNCELEHTEDQVEATL